MKLKPALAASLFALIAAVPFNASAATDNPADTKVEKAATPLATTPKAATKKKVKPHSHVEEKTGFPQKMPEAMPDMSRADKDKTKHFHPRDGK